MLTNDEFMSLRALLRKSKRTQKEASEVERLLKLLQDESRTFKEEQPQEEVD